MFKVRLESSWLRVVLRFGVEGSGAGRIDVYSVHAYMYQFCSYMKYMRHSLKIFILSLCLPADQVTCSSRFTVLLVCRL